MSKYAKRMTAAQKAKIIELYDKGYCAREIARRLGVCANAVWNHVFDRVPPTSMSNGEKQRISKLISLTERQVRSLRKKACVHGVPSTKLAEEYGISQSTALSCIKGRTYRWVGGPTIPHFKIRRPLGEQEIVWLKPERAMSVRRRGMRTGPKPGSKKLVKQGELIRVAKARGMSPCTVSKWLHNGRIKAENGRIDLRTVPRIKARV